MNPIFFASQADFRAWLEEHGATESELWIGYYKKASGKGGANYRETLDEALCFGWIDGVRRTVDAESFIQRWTPRSRRSHWSLVNIRRFKELQAEGRVVAEGLAAFEAATAERTGRYSFEQENATLDDSQEAEFRANTAAWAYWEKAPRSYKRIATWWVISAKRPETRAKRLAELIACSAGGLRIPLVRPKESAS